MQERDPDCPDREHPNRVVVFDRYSQHTLWCPHCDRSWVEDANVGDTGSSDADTHPTN